MNSIVKAEILWTRVCPLKCSYCKMATGKTNNLPLNYWKRTADQLKKLGCRFAAFYGAEPLADEQAIRKLGEVLKYFSELGIDTTLITSGAVLDLRKKLTFLHKKGLRSLTMSYDILPLDASSKAKSDKAVETLLWFKSLGARDVATVTTLTKWNYHLLPEHIEKMTEKGIWTFFDLIHADRGQEGSKCRNTQLTSELLFNDYHYEFLHKVLTEIARMKSAGYLCNTSIPFIELLKEKDFKHIRNYDWNCACSEVFPSWITIDYDGNTYPCDDFQPKDKTFSSAFIAEVFDEFKAFYKKKVSNECPGCLWNTHIDANFIKEGVLSGYGVEDAKKVGKNG